MASAARSSTSPPTVARRSRHRRARDRLLRQVTACWGPQALRVAIELDLPDRLAAASLDAETLAQQCGVAIESLQRLLRALCALGICRERSDGRFSLTAAGDALRQGETAGGPSLRAIVQWWAGPMWSLWPELGYSVTTGRSARERMSGWQGYAFLDAQPAAAATFHAAMQAMTDMIVDDVVSLDCWRDVREVVDVGGGSGTLAMALVAAHAHLRATVVDRPDAEATACAQIRAKGLSLRCHFVAGDFFTGLPGPRDAYLLKSILHNWDDDACARILTSCARAAAPGARLLLVERLRPRRLRPNQRDVALARADLNMLVGLGGRERSHEEYAELLSAAGFEPGNVRPTGLEFSIIESRRR